MVQTTRFETATRRVQGLSCLLSANKGPGVAHPLQTHILASLPRRPLLPPFNPECGNAPLTRVLLGVSGWLPSGAANGTEKQAIPAHYSAVSPQGPLLLGNSVQTSIERRCGVGVGRPFFPARRLRDEPGVSCSPQCWGPNREAPPAKEQKPGQKALQGAKSKLCQDHKSQTSLYPEDMTTKRLHPRRNVCFGDVKGTTC